MPTRPILFVSAFCFLVAVSPISAADHRIGSLGLLGECGYVGVTTLSGQIQYTINGTMTSFSSVPTSVQPLATRVICTLISPQQPFSGSPPTLIWEINARISGNTSATVFDPNTSPTTPAWPPRPVTICVSGDGEFGPDPQLASMHQICSDTAITPRRDDHTGAGAQTDATGWVVGCAGNASTLVCV
jgi:hypothetical protein